METITAKPTILETVRRELRLRNYSPKTIKAYRSCLRSFIRYFSLRHPRDLSGEDIRQYLIDLMESQRLAASSVNQAINAIKFLLVELYNR